MPTDVIGAMSAGGRLGLGRAELGERARESDQRTGLGYAQLGAEEASAGARLHAAAAQNALNLALHQSSLEEQRRRDESMQRARSEALSETTRKNKASEELRQKTIDAFQTRTETSQKTAMEKERLHEAYQRMANAERAWAAATASGDPNAVDKAESMLNEARAEYQRLSGGAGPEASTATIEPMAPVAPESIPGILPSQFNLGLPPAGMNPMDLSAPIGGAEQFQYEIKRKGK